MEELKKNDTPEARVGYSQYLETARNKANETEQAYQNYRLNAQMKTGLTTSDNRVYTFTPEEAEWVSSRYKNTFANGVMPQSSYSKYNKKSKYDAWALQMGMPSEKEIDKYLSAYSAYKGNGGLKDVYGGVSKDQWEKINELWSKDWEYGLTDEDARRKALGYAPVAYDDMYEDTLLDDELKANGLPPSKLLNGKLGETYNTWVKDATDYAGYNDAVTRKMIEKGGKPKASDGTVEGLASSVAATLSNPTGNVYTLQDAIAEVNADPKWSAFAHDHTKAEQRIPGQYDSKYIIKETDENGDKYDVTDANGEPIYDTDAWLEDQAKAYAKNAEIANDEFLITPEKLEQYYSDHAAEVQADVKTEQHFESLGIDLGKVPPEDYINVYNDYYAGIMYNDGKGVTLENLFPDTVITSEMREAYQPLVDNTNAIMRDKGFSAAYNYLNDTENAMRSSTNAALRVLDNVKAKHYESQLDTMRKKNPKLAGQITTALTESEGKIKETKSALDLAVATGDKKKIDAARTDYANANSEYFKTKAYLDAPESIWAYLEMSDSEFNSVAVKEWNYWNEYNGDESKYAHLSDDEFNQVYSEWYDTYSAYDSRESAYSALWGKDNAAYRDWLNAYNSESEMTAAKNERDAWNYWWANRTDEEKAKAEEDYASAQDLPSQLALAKQYRDATTYYRDKTYWGLFGTDKASNDKLKSTVVVPENQDRGDRLAAFVGNEYDAGKYDRDHGTSGSKYAAVVNEYSKIYGDGTSDYTFEGAMRSFTAVKGSVSSGKEIDRSQRFIKKVCKAKGITGRKEQDEFKDSIYLAYFMTDGERAKFNSIYETEGAEKADEYFEYLRNTPLANRAFGEIGNYYQELGESGRLAQEVASAFTVPINLAYGLPGTLDSLINGTDDSTTEQLRASKWNSAQSVRGAVAGSRSTAEAFVYQGGLSMADSFAAMGMAYIAGSSGASKAVVKLAEVAGTALLGGSKFNSSYEEALKRGVSPDKARLTATGQAINEMLFEYISMDKLVSIAAGEGIDIFKNAKSGWMKAIGNSKWASVINFGANSGVQSFVEGSEEVFTSAADRAWDNAVNGVMSEEAQRIIQLMDEGMSFEKAKLQAMDEFNEQLGQDLLGGMFSGFIMGGGAGAINVAREWQALSDPYALQDFFKATESISAVSVDDALKYAAENITRDTNDQITLDDAKNVFDGLLKQGADASVLSAVRNELIDENTPVEISTYMQTVINDTTTRDRNILANAVKKTLARYGVKGAKVAVDSLIENYSNAVSDIVQANDRSGMSASLSYMRSRFASDVLEMTGRPEHSAFAAGMRSVMTYRSSLNEEGQAAVEQLSKGFAETFRKNKQLLGQTVQFYADTAGAFVYAAQNSDLVESSKTVFGTDASTVWKAVRNACLNSDSKAASAFIDATVSAIGVYNGAFDASLVKTLSNGLDPVGYVSSMMGLAQARATNARSRVMYDNMVKFGVNESKLSLLSAANVYDSMTKKQQEAADTYVRKNSDGFMTSKELQDVTDEKDSADQEHKNKKKSVESRKARNAESISEAGATVARHQAECESYKTDVAVDDNGIEYRTVPHELAKAAADANSALRNAIAAYRQLEAENEGRLVSAENDLNKAKTALQKAERTYKTARNRYCAAYLQLFGSQMQTMEARGSVSNVELDRLTAFAMNGTRENLNDIEQKIKNAEKNKAAAIARLTGADIEVVKFTKEFCEKNNIRQDKPAAEKNGRIYIDENKIKARTGYMLNLLKHEFGHIVEVSAKNYPKFAKYARQYMEQTYGKEAVREQIEAWKADGMTEKTAWKELTAEFARTALLTDARAITALCQRAPVLSVRIMQWLNNTKATLANASLKNKTIDKALRAYIKAINDTRGNQTVVEKESTDAPVTRAVESARNAVEAVNEIEEAIQEGQKETAPVETKEEDETVKESPEETKEEETVEPEESVPTETVKKTEVPKDDFEDITVEEERPVDTKSNQQYNNTENKATVSLPFKLSAETRKKIMKAVFDLRKQGVDKQGKVSKKTNDTIAKMVKYQVTHDANYVDTPADILDAFAEQFKAPQNDVKSQEDVYAKQQKLMQGTGKKADKLSSDLGFDVDSAFSGSDGEQAFDEIQDANYYSEASFTPTEQQLHDPAWYFTSEAKDYWAKNPKYKDWAHPNLAYISAAAHNQVNLPYDMLMSIPEVRAAQEASDKMTENNHNSLKDFDGDSNREGLQDKWVRWIRGLEPVDTGDGAPYTYGSAQYYTDENGKRRVKYDGQVAKEKKAFLILGRPAAGKSSVFADPYSNHYMARIIDSDLIKEWTPEFRAKGGVATGYVQNESASLAERAMDEIIGYYTTDKNGNKTWHNGTGENIVLPRVGGPSITKLVDKLLDPKSGYEVTVLYNDLPQAKSIMRAMSRFAETGRYLDISYLHDDLIDGRFDVKCWKAFELLSNDNRISYLEWRDNDVGKGQSAIERWNSNDGRSLEQAKRDVEAEAGGNVVDSMVSSDVRGTGDYEHAGVSEGSEPSRVNYYSEFNPDILDQEYMPLAEKYLRGEATAEDKARMRQILNHFAMRKDPWRDEYGRPQQLYSGQKRGVTDFTPKNPGKNQIFTSSNMTVAQSYTKQYSSITPHVVEIKDQQAFEDDDVNVDHLLDNARRLLGENWTSAATHSIDEVVDTMQWYEEAFRNQVDSVEASNPPDIISDELMSKLDKYGDRKNEIVHDLKVLQDFIRTYPEMVRINLDSLFQTSNVQSSITASNLRWTIKAIDKLNDKLTALFASDPDTFAHGSTEWYYDFLDNDYAGGLSNKLGDLLGLYWSLLEDVNEYSGSNEFVNVDTNDRLTKDELYDRVQSAKPKSVYGVYAFRGAKPYEFDVDGDDWSNIRSDDYNGTTPREIFDNARKEDGATSMRVDNVIDWGYGLFNNAVNESKLGDDVLVPSDEDYYLVKSSDLVTLDDDGKIIPPSQRFNLRKNDVRYYTEANMLQQAINNMDRSERMTYGNPRIIQSENGMMVSRIVSSDGLRSGDPSRDGKRNIAMIARADLFMNGRDTFLRRGLSMNDCVALVIPSGDRYAELRSEALENGIMVVPYDETQPHQFENAQNIAADKEEVMYYPDEGKTWDDLISKYGEIPEGSAPRVANRSVPRQTTATNRVSQMAANAASAPVTTEDTFENGIKNWIANGTGTFEPISNARSLEKARGFIERAGSISQAARDLHSDVANSNGKATDLLARAEILYAQSQIEDNGLTDLEREQIFGDMCIIASDAGRALQLASQLKYMTAEGHIAYMEQVARRMEDRYQKRTKKRVRLELTEEEKAAYKGAVTEEERGEIDKKVGERFADETSDLTFLDRVRNWRYFSMLGNPRTHFRNMVGNALMNPVARVKDTINAGYQALAGIDQSERTTVAITGRVDADVKDWVEDQLQQALPIMQGVSSKYLEEAQKRGDTSETGLRSLWQDVASSAVTKGRTAVGRVLNKLSSFNSNALEYEDAKALGWRFRSAMYQIIKARGLDVHNMTETQRNDIVNYAMEESLRATFRDASALADAINKFANTNRATQFFMEAIIPFKKTPINIAKRSIEYSPLGLVQGFYKLFSAKSMYNTDIQNGISEQEALATYKRQKIAAIDRLAAGTTGSLLTAIGVFAAAMGWISIGRKDDEEAAFEQSLGKNAYSLNIGDLSIDLSAFSPAAVPLLMGAALYGAVGADRDEQIVEALISTLAESVDPITEMSMLSGLADSMKGISYASNEDGGGTRYIGQVAGNAASSYVGQFIPTFLGQVARVTDPYARSYTAGDDYWATKIAGSGVGTVVKGLQNKIPFVAWLSEPKVDLHGNPVKNYTNWGSYILHPLNNFILPATIKVDSKNEIDDELVRLYGVVDSADIFPTKPSRSLGSVTTKNGSEQIKITSDAEYTQYQQEYGQTVYDMLEDLMRSSAYKRMTDVQKAEAIEKTITQAKSATKKRWKAQKTSDKNKKR